MEFYPPVAERSDKELFEIIDDPENWQPDIVKASGSELIKRGFDRSELQNRMKSGEKYSRKIAAIKANSSYSVFEMILMIVFWPVILMLPRFLRPISKDYNSDFKKRNNQTTACLFIGLVLWIGFFVIRAKFF